MKPLTILLAVVCCVNAYAQDSKFIIEGQIVDSIGLPIADVYVINPKTLEKDITRANGIFKLPVNPEDSLVVSHIAFFRQTVSVYQLLHNPVITLEFEDLLIPEIFVSPKNMTDQERAQQNMKFLNDYRPPKYNKLNPEVDITTQTITAHNRLMRTEAGSVSLLPILGLPVKLIDKFFEKRKRRKMYKTGYYSTRKTKTPE